MQMDRITHIKSVFKCYALKCRLDYPPGEHQIIDKFAYSRSVDADFCTLN
jgi:hypothetical protein